MQNAVHSTSSERETGHKLVQLTAKYVSQAVSQILRPSLIGRATSGTG
jgi:hypothetical protein